MATDLSSVRKKKTSGFMTILTSAACEWFLILFLFVDAIFAYLLKKFAQYCDLQTPCSLCSMFDNIFQRKKPGCCWSIVCNNHKEEISTLVSCSTHGKLADVHGMCEECFMPIAMQNNSESLKLLLGKVWVDVEPSVLQNLMVNKLIKLGSSEGRACSCCNKTWKANSNTEGLLGLKPIGLGASKANAKPPLPRVPVHSRLRCRDRMKRLRGKFTVPKRQQPCGSDSVSTLSHVGYSKLNFSSNSESEFPLSDDDGDDGNMGSSGNNSMKTEDDFVGFGRDLPRTLANDVITEKQTHQGSEVKDQGDLLDLNEKKNVCSLSTDGTNEHCLREISINDICISTSNGKYLSDSLSQSAENMELSCGHEVEPFNASDSAKPEKDMKPMPQVSTSEVGLLLKDSSPRPLDGQNESRKAEDSSSQSLKRNDSSYESLDGISVDDIEGENIVDRLRRQVEHDRSCMESLYKELEEERNAGAVAVNEAMAMIMRLQEEKAALQMEARQYLRMMEEQSEYDKKVLERANDLLSDREKELQDLEYELELYRNNSPDKSGFEDLRKETSLLENYAECAKISKANGTSKSVSSSVLNFEDEKLYISQCLKKLEKNLYKAYSSGNLEEVPNGLNSERSSTSNGSPARHYESIDSPADVEENDFHYENGDKENYEKSAKFSNSAAYEKEIAALHDRLEALETDRDLLKYASNLLQNGEDGLQLIQDLAQQLEESRKIEFRER